MNIQTIKESISFGVKAFCDEINVHMTKIEAERKKLFDRLKPQWKAIGAQITSIDDYFVANWKNKTETFECENLKDSDGTAKVAELGTKRGFYTFLVDQGFFHVQYEQSSKYASVYRNYDNLSDDNLKKYGIEKESLADLNQAAIFAKNPPEYGKRSEKAKPNRKISHLLSKNVDLRYFESQGLDNAKKEALNILFMQFGLSGLSPETMTAVFGASSVESILQKVKADKAEAQKSALEKANAKAKATEEIEEEAEVLS